MEGWKEGEVFVTPRFLILDSLYILEGNQPIGGKCNLCAGRRKCEKRSGILPAQRFRRGG